MPEPRDEPAQTEVVGTLRPEERERGERGEMRGKESREKVGEKGDEREVDVCVRTEQKMN